MNSILLTTAIFRSFFLFRARMSQSIGMEFNQKLVRREMATRQESPATGCPASKEELISDGFKYSDDCKICRDDFNVLCRVTKHPSRPLSLTEERSLKKKRAQKVVTAYDLVKNLGSLPRMQHVNSPNHFVDVERVVNDSILAIDREFVKEPDITGSFRRNPLMFSRFARGGKTTILIALQNELVARGYHTLFISFNGCSGFNRNLGESEESCIKRLIVAQLVNTIDYSPNELQTLYCDENVIDNYLDQQSNIDGSLNRRRFVLLIDELNALGQPLSAQASKMLHRLFLQKNRYLVFSTHVPYVFGTTEQIPSEAREEEELDSPSFKRSGMMALSMMTIVPMPQSSNLEDLRQIDPSCAALTPHQATFYGGVPSLIYSVLTDRESPQQRFSLSIDAFSQKYNYRRLSELERTEYLRLFVKALFDGSRTHLEGPLVFFDRFSSMTEKGKVRWVLCYLTEVLKVLSIPIVEPLIDEIDKIAKYEVPTFAALVQTGLDWQCVVDLAMLLRALYAVLTSTDHLLIPNFIVKRAQFIAMPAEIETLEGAKQFIESQVNVYGRASGDLLIIRSNYAKFPLFDGFIVGILDSIPPVTSGYQVKLGRNTPTKEIPAWVNGGGHLLRGLASGSPILPRGWRDYSAEEIREFLGYSLIPLYPASWIVPPDAHFD